MAAFNILAKVDQIVTKEVKFLIEAKTEEEATEKARAILDVYPEPIPYDPMVHRIVTTKIHFWIPKSIEFVVEEETIDQT